MLSNVSQQQVHSSEEGNEQLLSNMHPVFCQTQGAKRSSGAQWQRNAWRMGASNGPMLRAGVHCEQSAAMAASGKSWLLCTWPHLVGVVAKLEVEVGEQIAAGAGAAVV